MDDGSGSFNKKFIERWATIYVDKLLKDKNDARSWAHRFLPRETIDAVAAASRQILKSRGFKVIEE